MYRNPVIRGFHPDPSICRVGADFYLVTSSFEYFPGLPVFHSTDLVSWTRIGHCLSRPDQVNLSSVPSSGGVWAPTIRHDDGVFYVITTIMDEARFANELNDDDESAGPGMTGRHLLLTARDPAGPWSDPVWVDGDGLDPSLLFDDGRALMTYAHQGVVLQCELDPVTGKQASKPQAIWTGTTEITSEGPHLYRVGDLYYLLVAEGGTSYGHSVAVARSSSPWGPWEEHPSNPVLSHRTVDRHPVQGTGHADLVQDAEGQWWIVFLGIRPHGYPSFHVLGRETFLAPVRWQDGWPFVDGPVGLEVGDGACDQQRPPASWRDDFATPVPEGHWNTLCGPDPAVSVVGGKLMLRPATTKSDRGHRAFAGTRQVEVNCTVQADVLLRPVADGDEVGLTVRMDDRHHYDVGVVQVHGTLVVRLLRRIGSLLAESASVSVPGGPLILRITSTPWMYSFWVVGVEGAQDILIGKGEAFYLSTEVAGGFTGVYIGPYAVGQGDAEVDWFELGDSSVGPFSTDSPGREN